MEEAHKRELETINKMENLKAEGFSYHKIADILNTMKVPTKNKGSRWHGTTVMKILKTSTSQSSNLHYR